MADQPSIWQEQFLEAHQLDASYLVHARKWFTFLAAALAEHQKSAGRPILVGVNGCQGSGKTTLCDYLAADMKARYGLRAIALSLDDFYHTRARREQLAREVHPLLATRGVPGTHNVDLLQQTLARLLTPGLDPVSVPRFDKATDDRRPRRDWGIVEPGIDLVLLEGWCLGARPETGAQLEKPVNELEQSEDPDGVWRRYVNRSLAEDFISLYSRIDQWVMLRAPSFDCVLRWRQEQERKLAATTGTESPNRIMNEGELERFVRFFQRLTERCLQTLPEEVDYLYHLDGQRNITN